MIKPLHLYHKQLCGATGRVLFVFISPQNRRTAAERAPPASDPPPPDWRWSSWWWSSAPSLLTRSNTPAGCHIWSPRSTAPQTPGPAGCAVARPPPGSPPPRSGWLPSPPRLLRSVPVRAAAARPMDFHECRDGLWFPHCGVIADLRRLRAFRGAPQCSGANFAGKKNFASNGM